MTDHKHKFSDPDRFAADTRNCNVVVAAEIRFVQQKQPDFGTYLKRYYRTPYNNWSSLAHKDFDFIIRFEHLQDDFAEAMRRIGLELKRPSRA